MIPMEERIELGNLLIDRDRYEAWLGQARLGLTYFELEILSQLALNPRKVLSRQQLISDIWGEDANGYARKLTVHISRLRRKMADSRPWTIETVKKRGYCLTDRPRALE